MFSTAKLTLALAALSLASLTDHSGPHDPAPRPTPTPQFELSAGDYAVRDLVDRSARYLGRNYLYEVNEMPDSLQVTLQNDVQVDERGCEELVSQILYTKGFALVAIDRERGLYEWVLRFGPRRMEIPAQAEFVPMAEVETMRKMSGTTITTVVSLENVDSHTAANQLRPFLAQAGNSITVGSLGDGEALLLQGFAPQVHAAVQLLRLVEGAETEPRATEDAKPGGLQSQIDALQRRIEKLERTQKKVR